MISPHEKPMRPEDILHALAAGEDNLGARVLRMAQDAAGAHRASILDLLSDDPAPLSIGAGEEDLRSLHGPALDVLSMREPGSAPPCDIVVGPAQRRMEVTR